MHLHNYLGIPIRIIDGDTAVIKLDLGFSIFHETPCRLLGINTKELFGVPKDTPDFQLALKAKTYLAETILNVSLFVHSSSLDKYGRPLVLLYYHEPEKIEFSTSINQTLINLGLATPYP